LTRDTRYQDDWFVIEFVRRFDTCDEDDYKLDVSKHLQINRN